MISNTIEKIEKQLVAIGEAEVFEFDVNDITTLLNAYKNVKTLYNKTSKILYRLENSIMHHALDDLNL